MNPVTVRRRTHVALAALPLMKAGRQVELAEMPVLARVAVLTEAAGSLAAMARRQAHLGHVDPRAVAYLVTDPTDAMAVLGHGRWLPTMQRRVLAPPRQIQLVRVTKGRPPMPGQLPLFQSNALTRKEVTSVRPEPGSRRHA